MRRPLHRRCRYRQERVNQSGPTDARSMVQIHTAVVMQVMRYVRCKHALCFRHVAPSVVHQIGFRRAGKAANAGRTRLHQLGPLAWNQAAQVRKRAKLFTVLASVKTRQHPSTSSSRAWNDWQTFACWPITSLLLPCQAFKHP